MPFTATTRSRHLETRIFEHHRVVHKSQSIMGGVIIIQLFLYMHLWGESGKWVDYHQSEYVILFLIGLNESFFHVRAYGSFLVLIKNNVSLFLLEEKQQKLVLRLPPMISQLFFFV